MYELLPQINNSPDKHPFHETPSQFLLESVFAGGNFWAIEAAYGNIDGIFKTSTGYFGGPLKNPSYKEVCEGGTGHTEAVKIVYDCRVISFASLCDLFWDSHDPTNKEFLNFGLSTHQRSAIFYSTEDEKKEAQKSKIKRQMRLNRRIVTKILPLRNCEFFMAENKHQKYYLQKHHRLCGSLGLRSSHHFVESTIACKLNGILGLREEQHIIDELGTFLNIQELPSPVKFECEEIIEELSSMKKENCSNFTPDS